MAWGVNGPTVAVNAHNVVIDIIDGFGLDGVTVAGAYPDTAGPSKPVLPFVGVMDLGSPSFNAVVETTVLQVSCWAEYPDDASALAAVVRGRLLDSRGAGRVGSILPGSRLAPARDVNTGYWIAAFTVRVVSRPNGG